MGKDDSAAAPPGSSQELGPLTCKSLLWALWDPLSAKKKIRIIIPMLTMCIQASMLIPVSLAFLLCFFFFLSFFL